MSDTTTSITAIPCGRRADGNPTPRRTFVITREPEPFDPTPDDPRYATWDGRRRARLWGKCWASARHGLDRTAPLAIVFMDSIEVAR